MIEVKNLVKKYGDHVAVDHLSFQIEKGQVYGFLGPNGAGKSTTMNIMTGYIASTEGEVIIDGFNIVDEPEEAKKRIGYLPELPPLYVDMTVGEYLSFAAELKKIPKKERRTQMEAVMEMVGITDMEGRLIKNLSKGYKQRVWLAQAILGYPEIIILDEPTVGLDPKQIIEIRDLIRKLSKKHTVILSSHILSEVSAVCDYVMIINHGKLIASDKTENLEKMTLGSNTLEVSVKGKQSDIKKVLDKIEVIRELKWKDTKEDIISFVLETEEKDDIREELFYLMAEHRMPIMEMKSTTISLEDIFLELTENDRNLLEGTGKESVKMESAEVDKSAEMKFVKKKSVEKKSADKENEAEEGGDKDAGDL